MTFLSPGIKSVNDLKCERQKKNGKNALLQRCSKSKCFKNVEEILIKTFVMEYKLLSAVYYLLRIFSNLQNSCGKLQAAPNRIWEFNE